MKKNKILLLVLVLFMAFSSRVYAEEEDRTCNAVSLNELRTLASNVKINYVEDTITQSYFDAVTGEYAPAEEDVLYIKIYNMTSRIYISYEMTGAGIQSDPDKNKILTLDDVGEDGTITIKQGAKDTMVNYTFKIFSDAYGCSNKTLRTVKLTLPRYNYYSKQSICRDIPEYYLCKPFVTFNGDNNEDFYEKVTEYKEKLAEQKKEEEDDGDNIISDTLSGVSKYKYIIVGVIVLVGAVITILILRRKRSDK